MSSCLGLYIETNLIKYAKVTKDKDDIKVESFGVKFYDKIGEAINQIIAETYSYKTPISVNLSDEVYHYFYFPNILNKNDLKKSIEIEFESYCNEHNDNINALETRYALVEDMQDREKIKAIFISTGKMEINRKLDDLEGNTVACIAAVPMAIANLTNAEAKENSIIINLEEKTTVTTILDEKIYNVDKLKIGMGTILNNISEKENSHSKAYEICKNTTIYTMEGRELLQDNENLYLDEIMPTLYKIVQEVQTVIDSSLNNIDKIYITGTGCLINNIDLYFQEYFNNIKCEILKPYFIPETVKINMKDYIEVNSAIAIAMQGVGYGIKNLNFKKASFSDSLPDWMKLEIGGKKGKKKENGEEITSEGKKGSKLSLPGLDKLPKISFNMKGKIDPTERWMLRATTGLIAFLIIYIIIIGILRTSTETKMAEVDENMRYTQQQISLVESDIRTLNNKTSDYQSMIENLKTYSDAAAEKNKTKNVIPTLLSELMYIIPKGVTITSIENTTENHIVISAQSPKYELLGYLKGKIITDGILSPSTVVSTSGTKQSDMVMIVIEGDLP